MSPESVLTTVPERRTVTASVPADAGWMRATAVSFPYSAGLPVNATVTAGRTASWNSCDVA